MVGNRSRVATQVSKSEGSRQLLALLNLLTRTEVALAVGQSREAVGQWASGRKLPGLRARLALLELYGIQVTAWDREPAVAPADMQRAAILTLERFARALGLELTATPRPSEGAGACIPS